MRSHSWKKRTPPTVLALAFAAMPSILFATNAGTADANKRPQIFA